MIMYLIFNFQPSDTIPSVDLHEETPDNVVNLRECSRGKKIVLIAVPGAFTPVCTEVKCFEIIHYKQQGFSVSLTLLKSFYFWYKKLLNNKLLLLDDNNVYQVE